MPSLSRTFLKFGLVLGFHIATMWERTYPQRYGRNLCLTNKNKKTFRNMRFVQTFWTANINPLDKSFGWVSPEFNIMSWALSCLCIRKHYDNLELYTDENGYKLLIEQLSLPYTKVHVIYDKNLCLPKNWAYAKIKTYSLQDCPFLHIDGDVYLSAPLPGNILNAPLVVQNRELGGSYYASMLEKIHGQQSLILPDCIKIMDERNKISSFNMGVFGGGDIDFIRNYCEEAMSFVNDNGINDLTQRISGLECNLFFEQIIFAAKADCEEKEVASVLGRTVLDFGYTVKDFCNLDMFSKKGFFHILGGHKRNAHICRMLQNTLIREYPKYYGKIVRLFQKHYSEIVDKRVVVNPLCPREYINLLETYKKKIENVDDRIIGKYEEETAWNSEFIVCSPEEQQMDFTISVSPLIEIVRIPCEWKDNQGIRAESACEENFPLSAIGLIPTCFFKHIEQIALLDFDVEIVNIIRKGASTVINLQKNLLALKGGNGICSANYIMEELVFLVKNGIVTAQKQLT